MQKVNTNSKRQIRIPVISCGTVILLLTTSTVFSYGEDTNFTLDLMPDTNSDGSFGWGGGGGGRGGFGGGSVGNSDDQTSFLQESVGNGFIHQLIGTVDDDFVQEVYIQSSSYSDTSMNDPFGQGTASANPTRVLLRQRVRDAESVNEVLKDNWSTKPVITSIVVSDEIVNTFIADMNEISYQDDTTPAPTTITLTFTDPLLDQEFRPEDFDLATDAQKSTIHGGRFTYDSGRYSYADGDGFNLNGINWSAFCDPSQNQNSSDGFGGWDSGGANYCDGGSSAGGSTSSGGWGW